MLKCPACRAKCRTFLRLVKHYRNEHPRVRRIFKRRAREKCARVDVEEMLMTKGVF